MRIVAVCRNFKSAFERKFEPLTFKVSKLWKEDDESGSDVEEQDEAVVNAQLLQLWLNSGIQRD